MMENVRRFDIVAFTTEFGAAFEESTAADGDYCDAAVVLAAIAELNATIERLRATLAETWQPVLDRTPTPCTCGFCDGRVFQDHGILHILQGDVNLAVHLPDDVRLCRKE